VHDLAYYASADLGVLAPRGWTCFGFYGSNGSTLIVTPEAVKQDALIAGPAVQLSFSEHDTSGRFEVAEVAARLFPNKKEFVQQIIHEGIVPESYFPFGPYPDDILTRRSDSVVEFETPANTNGMGTKSRMKKNADPISGVAIMTGDGDLVQLNVRTSPALRYIVKTILEDLQRESASLPIVEITRQQNASATAALAGPLESGEAAYQRGDYEKAVRLFRVAAAQGDADAQFLLGAMYENGQGVEQDYAEALKWYRRAAAQGNAAAQLNLGVMYDNGQGVAQNYAEAVRWLRLSAAQGLARAQADLGVMYRDGQGVPQNYAEAVKWFRLAAMQGDANGRVNLGVAYTNGAGVTQDHAEAIKWYRLAAAQGDGGAQYNLGLAYFDGRGIAQNYVRAHMWFNLSAGSGLVRGPEARNFVAAMMTPQQIAEAQKIAQECQQRNFKGCD
jgi:TPR repeat protein